MPVTMEDNVWSLEKFQAAFPNFPVVVRSGQVAIKADMVVCTDMVICATHRVSLVPDLHNSLTTQNPPLERVCPSAGCQTRATVSAKYYDAGTHIRQSINHIKKLNAASHFGIHGPASKTHQPKP